MRVTILLIDDSASVREVLRVALESESYRVLEAADGREGVRLFREHRPALVLVDIVMPEKDGIETVKEILAFDPAAVVFTMSGQDEDYQEVARMVGVKRGFRKPVKTEELLRAVASFLPITAEEMGEYVRGQRQYASFFEGRDKDKETKELGVVRELLRTMEVDGETRYHSPCLGNDPPDCVAQDTIGRAVAFEVTELVSGDAIAQNKMHPREPVYWIPSPGEVVELIRTRLNAKDEKVYEGGPYSEIILVIHTDEFALEFDRYAPLLQHVQFGRSRWIARAFLLFSYDPRQGRCPFLELRV